MNSNFVKHKCDVLIIGGGISGLSIGIALLERKTTLKVIIVEKESYLGAHASSRNSGVLHAGFYYSPGSLKSKFCRDGNFVMREIAKNLGLPIKNTGKIIVTKNESEISTLIDLVNRAAENGIDLELFNSSKLKKFEPLAITHDAFAWSPNTAVIEPKSFLKVFENRFKNLGGIVHLETLVGLSELNNEIIDISHRYEAKFYVNSAGTRATQIAHNCGAGLDYSSLPFLGLYRVTHASNLPLKTLVYPVPHQLNPFLGVHFTVTVDGKTKLGPTAIPIPGSEFYSLRSGMKIKEVFETCKSLISLLSHKEHNLAEIMKEEFPKIFEKSIVNDGAQLVPSALKVTKWKTTKSGIRAQLVKLSTGQLSQDFIVEQRLNSLHILNNVSPGWTSAIPFGRHIADLLIKSDLTS